MTDSESDTAAILIHVGADTSNLGYVGPHFNDAETFKFLPMKEDNPTIDNPTYEDLGLADFVIGRDKTARVHNDPQFDNRNGLFSYGENETEKSRLSKLKVGSIMFFVSSLAPFKPEYYQDETTLTAMKTYQKGIKNKYIIGFFTIAGIRHIVVKLSGEVQFKDSIKVGSMSKKEAEQNQHFSEVTGPKEFIVVKGDPNHSAILHTPIPLTDGQIKGTFGLSDFGIRLFKNKTRKDKTGKKKRIETDNFRGVRDLDLTQAKLLVQEVHRTNRKLMNKLRDLR